jgi:hypothetical protein
MVAEKGGKIILEIPDGLAPLVVNAVNIDGIYRRGDKLPHFDVHCPLMSLPLAFRHDDRHHSGVRSVSPCTRQACQGLAGTAGGHGQAADRSRLVGKTNPQE